MQSKFLQLDSLDSLRDYWEVKDSQGSNLKKTDFSTILSLVSQHYLEGESSHPGSLYLVELARDVDIKEVAFEICARLVSEGYAALLPSESGSVYNDLAEQHNKLFTLVIEQHSNISGTSDGYSAQLNRSMNEAMLHKKIPFPVLFLKYQSVPSHGKKGQILATKAYRKNNDSPIKLWSPPILFFVAGIVLFY